MLQNSTFHLSASSMSMADQVTRRWVTPASLADALMPAVLVIAGVCVLAFSARIQIPFYPVPLTLQTLAIMMLAMSYGGALAGTTLFSYLMAGYLGAPVFASGAGFAYMMGPTGGYLAGFFVAAVILGYMSDRGWTRHFTSSAAAMVVGTSVIYVFGVAWLSQLIGFEKAVGFGMLPFIYGDILKLVIAALAMPYLWRIVETVKSGR